jgi:lauroyl/myristoyl acyltransferase
VTTRPALLPAVDTAAVASPRWYSHGLNRAAVYRAAAAAAAALPRRARLALAVALATLVARRLIAEREAVAASLRRFVPAASAERRAALARELFGNFAVCFADLIAANRRRRLEPLLARVDGMDRLAALRRDPRGCVVLTAHVGNWELAGRLLAGHAARPTHVVVAAEADPGVERFLRGAPAPVRFVVRRDPTSVLPLIGALRRGEIVAMQGDRALGTRADVTMPFFGAPAPFPLGPFVLARAAGVAVVPSFCVLEAGARYAIHVGEAIEVAAGSEHAALARWVGALEDVVRAHPTQWFNFFDVWGSAPAR